MVRADKPCQVCPFNPIVGVALSSGWDIKIRKRTTRRKSNSSATKEATFDILAMTKRRDVNSVQFDAAVSAVRKQSCGAFAREPKTLEGC
jgi:hypothetical protein